jgi:Opacity family porin protein
MMVPKISAQFFSHSLLTGTFALISIGNAIASEIPTVQVSAVDRQSELLVDSTDDSIAKIGGIYPINTLLNPESAPATSNLALARRKKRINTKPQIKREGSNTQPQIQNTPVNTAPQIQSTPINTPPQVQSLPINTQPQVQNPQINTPPPQPSGLTATQNQIQYRRNDLGVAVQFGNGTSIGIQGKLGLTDNISIRPEFFFGSGGGELENKEFPSSQTSFVSDFENQLQPIGLKYPLDADKLLILTQPFVVPGIDIRVNQPFINNTNAVLGVRRPAGNDFRLLSIPAGAVILAGDTLITRTLPQGLVLPSSLPIVATDTEKPTLNFVYTENFKIPTSSLLTAAYTTSIPFTTNVAIGNFPAGTTIPAGTIFEKGILLPAGLNIPYDPRTPNNISLVTPPGAIKSKITKSTSIGLAVTYDFKLDPQGKSTAYLGPKVAFTSTVGDVNVPGITTPLTLNANETKIGLVAGIDYVIFDGFTIGANANYYFSRNLSGSVNSPTGPIDFQSSGGGSSTDFGLRIGYQF